MLRKETFQWNRFLTVSIVVIIEQANIEVIQLSFNLKKTSINKITFQKKAILVRNSLEIILVGHF